MRPTNQIKRALASVTVDSHRAITSRAQQATYYELAEREQQFQYPVKGTVGRLPVEAPIKILFDIRFIFEYGYRRDSQLNEPITRFGFSELSAPPGTVPYAHVQEWIQDDDLNFVGANVLVGAHNPNMAIAGTDPITSVDFKATLHCSFQGYGSPIDVEDPGDASAEPSGNELANSGGSNANGSPGDGTFPPPSGASFPLTTEAALAATPDPDYPAGPLGGTGNWEQITHWDGSVNTLDAWDIIPGEGPLKVDHNLGILTTADPYAVREDASRAVQESGLPDNQPDFGAGDKYAANFVKGGKLGDGHKVRMKVNVEYWGPALGDNIDCSNAITFRMRNRYDGIGFFFGPLGIGWVTNLNLLGFVRYVAGLLNWVNSHNNPIGKVFMLPPVPPSYLHGQGPAIDIVEFGDGRGFTPGTPAQQNPDGTPTPAWKAQYEYCILDCENLAQPRRVWVELWRDGLFLRAAIWHGDDDPDTDKPMYMSQRSVTHGGDYGPEQDGYFGWVRGHMMRPNDATAVAIKKDFGFGPGKGPMPQGIASVTTYRRTS